MAKELTPRNLLEAATSGDVGKVMKLLDMSSYDQSESRENPVSRLNVRDQDGRTAFYHAVMYKNIVAIQTLARAGADINLSDKMKCTPLVQAAREGHAVCVDELIKLGADIHCVDTLGNNALMFAAQYGNENCMQLLIKAGVDLNLQFKRNGLDNLGKTVLMLAAERQYLATLKLLLEAGADVNVQTSDGETALMFAAQHGCLDTLKSLLEAGTDVNVQTSDGKTALHYAFKFVSTGTCCRCHSVESNNDSVTCDYVRILVDFGSDVTTTDSKGETALMYAARNCSMINSLSILVKAGAVVDQQDSSGMTALAHAVRNGIHGCVRRLVDLGASVNICDSSGKTPLHFLLFYSDNDADATKCLEILLSKHPDVNATDKDGMTPLMNVARKLGRETSTMEMLLENGAEINRVDNQGQTALIHSLGLDFSKSHIIFSCLPTNVIVTHCFHFLLWAGANLSIGQLVSGQLSRLVYLDCDLDLIKLQVGSTVDLKVPFDNFVLLFSGRKRRILQFLIINGVMPLQSPIYYTYERLARFSSTSWLKVAAVNRKLGAGEMKYLIATCYLLSEDLKFLCSGHAGDQVVFSMIDQTVFSMMNNLSSQPWPLVKLCFVAVSTVFGASPGRQERVKNSQLPVKIQKMLLFQEPWSRLCVHQWDEIPLTFSPEEYEKLPRPRPLLYHWPVGRALVPCDCGECDGTVFKYEISRLAEKEN